MSRVHVVVVTKRIVDANGVDEVDVLSAFSNPKDAKVFADGERKQPGTLVIQQHDLKVLTIPKAVRAA